MDDGVSPVQGSEKKVYDKMQATKRSKLVLQYENDDDDDEELLRIATAAEKEHDRLSSAQFLCECPAPEEETRKESTYVDAMYRYVVVQFLHNQREEGRKTPSVTYIIRSERSFSSSSNAYLVLRDAWARTPIMRDGTIFNIVDCQPDDNGTFVVERNKGYVVVEPDRLVSVTNVTAQTWCERKVAFSERFRFPFDNTDTLRGTIAHELIGQCMQKRLTTRPEVATQLEEILRRPSIIEMAYGAGITQEGLMELREELVNCVLRFNTTRLLSRNPKQQKWQIQDVRDIEDCHWSPEFGIKGKVDCAIQVQLDDNGEKLIVPLEFKTGNARFEGKFNVRTEHVGQVRLYTMLMRQSFGLLHNKGILYYIRENNLVECTAATTDLQALIMARNTIVFNKILNLDKTGSPFSGLPDPSGVQFDFHCQRCEYRNVCAVSVKLKRSGSYESQTDVQQKLADSVGHLTPNELAFFDRWLRVLILEADEEDTASDAKNLWLDSIPQREKDGKCLGNLQFQCQEIVDTTPTAHISFSIPESKKAALDNIGLHDFVVLGTERDPCIRHGFVFSVTALSITLSVERILAERYTCPGLSFTVDKVASSSPGMIQFVYLSKLMEDTPEATRARQYVVQKRLPIFQTLSPQDFTEDETQILAQYNTMQKTAILKCLTTDSFLLVKGCPGCGKTATIVGLCRLLVARGKTILLSAYTNNAVDNILANYKQYSQNFVRVGSGGILCKEQLIANSSNFLRTTAPSVDKLAQLYNATPVVAATLLSLKHCIFKTRTSFDYCIIDEGSQALPTAVFGALLLARKVVIFGDPNQLPTIIKCSEIKNLNIEDSMFSLLSQPKNTYELSVQYRMNESIMMFPNQLMYGNKMTCATNEQAAKCIRYSGDKVSTFLKEKISLPSTRTWLSSALSKRPDRSVMFLDTQNISAFERVVSSTLQNRKEKDIAMSIVYLLIYGGVLPGEIGIIAPYRGQVDLLRKSLRIAELDVEVNTVDQYQGREKNIIVMSFTKSLMSSNDFVREDGILNEARRVNVAITRAKSKIIFIGNSGTLKKFPACNDLISLLSDRQKYIFNLADFPPYFFQDDV